MKNIVFSTTRQWNPGDEIILQGIRNVLKHIGLRFNPIIFNRNPDIRGFHSPIFKMHIGGDVDFFRCCVNSAMFDNSIKPWTDYSAIDAIIFAGSPEWQGMRSLELYINAVRYKIPVFLIGIDSAYRYEFEILHAVLKKAKFISIRNKDILDSFSAYNIQVNHITCPSILSSETTKNVKRVKAIGLIYRGNDCEVSFINGWNIHLHNEQIELYKYIIREYSNQYQISIICHYIDEIIPAQKYFPECEILYSYDSFDYHEIYSKFDLIIGSRIHGIGIAASLGIPSIPVKYDVRASTVDSFYPDWLVEFMETHDMISTIDYYLRNIGDLNSMLCVHKDDVKNKYETCLKELVFFDKVDYEYVFENLRDEFMMVRHEFQIDKQLYHKAIRPYVRFALNRINEMIVGKEIIIKGAGMHTRKLLCYITKRVKKIYLCDKNDKRIEDYPMIDIREINSIHYDFIILSSRIYESSMRAEIDGIVPVSKIISIYKMMDDNGIHLNEDFYFYIERGKSP